MATTCGFGQIPDIRCTQICLLGKVFLDRDCNVDAANIKAGNVIVRNTLYTDNICEKIAMNGVNFCGNVIVPDPYAIEANLTCTNLLQTDYISAKNNGNITIEGNIIINDDFAYKWTC